MSGDFSEQMTRLCRFFRVTATDSLKRELERLRHIPPNALSDVVDGFVTSRRPTPGQFPTVNEISMEWYQLRKDHPEKCAPTEEWTPCKGCGGSGFVTFRQLVALTLREYDVTARCGECRNWRNSVSEQTMPAIAVRADIERRGIEVWPYEWKPK